MLLHLRGAIAYKAWCKSKISKPVSPVSRDAPRKWRGTHRASGEELLFDFARLATPAVNSSLFSLIFRSAPEKQNQKQRPQKPRNRQKPQRGGRALRRPTTDRNPDQKPDQKPNQTDRPTDRTQYRTRAGSRHQTTPLNSHVCIGPFFTRNLQPPSSGLYHVHLGRAGNQRP